MPDVPGIQAKEYHTDEELRTLALEALSVAYPSVTWATAHTDGSAEKAANLAEVEFVLSSPRQLHQVCGYRAAVSK